MLANLTDNWIHQNSKNRISYVKLDHTNKYGTCIVAYMQTAYSVDSNKGMRSGYKHVHTRPCALITLLAMVVHAVPHSWKFDRKLNLQFSGMLLNC